MEPLNPEPESLAAGFGDPPRCHARDLQRQVATALVDFLAASLRCGGPFKRQTDHEEILDLQAQP